MNREELIDRIAKGAAYLQREDISPREREIAQEKYDRYRHELRQMDKQPDDRVQQCISTIREILKPISKER